MCEESLKLYFMLKRKWRMRRAKDHSWECLFKHSQWKITRYDQNKEFCQSSTGPKAPPQNEVKSYFKFRRANSIPRRLRSGLPGAANRWICVPIPIMPKLKPSLPPTISVNNPNLCTIVNVQYALTSQHNKSTASDIDLSEMRFPNVCAIVLDREQAALLHFFMSFLYLLYVLKSCLGDPGHATPRANFPARLYAK